MATIGTRNTLTVLKTATPGLYLDGGELGEILLPRRYIPHGVEPGDTLDVFLYRDSEDRLVATTETLMAMVSTKSTISAPIGMKAQPSPNAEPAAAAAPPPSGKRATSW